MRVTILGSAAGGNLGVSLIQPDESATISAIRRSAMPARRRSM